MKPKILVTGANGQIGTALVSALREEYGVDNVVSSDITKPKIIDGPHCFLDILNEQRLEEHVKDLGITQIYHLAAILSANGEWNPLKTWNINFNGLLSVLNLAKDQKIERIFFPSTIAVHGPNTPRQNTPQHVPLDPSTVYGMSKVTGEMWCNYYHKRYGVDIRSVRYPGIIGYQSIPQGGTTDYAVEIFHEALKGNDYECFLAKDTRLPMMYMPDAINATIKIMQAPAYNLKIRTSYNLAAMDFTPEEIYQEIKKHIPNFKINYKPDFRQEIASSWSESIDDHLAREDWSWQHKYDLQNMTTDMLHQLKSSYE